MNDENPQKAVKDGYTTKHGLIYKDDKIVGLPTADRIAHEYGFVYAEHLVKALEALK